jgi:hypothetical protein
MVKLVPSLRIEVDAAAGEDIARVVGAVALAKAAAALRCTIPCRSTRCCS